jgi:hypothetical protein
VQLELLVKKFVCCDAIFCNAAHGLLRATFVPVGLSYTAFGDWMSKVSLVPSPALLALALSVIVVPVHEEIVPIGTPCVES